MAIQFNGDRNRAAYFREYRKNPEQQWRNRARSLVSMHVLRGKIVRQPCGKCGAPDAEAHHPNYDKPLLIEWLCKACHVEEHWDKPPQKSVRERSMRVGVTPQVALLPGEWRPVRVVDVTRAEFDALKAEVAALRELIASKAVAPATKSRAAYYREYRKRKSEA